MRCSAAASRTFAARSLASAARAGEVFFVVGTHPLGEVRELALVGDVRRGVLHFGQFVADVLRQLQRVEARRRQLRQLPGERQHVECLAAARAATRALIGLVFFGVVHRDAGQPDLNGNRN